MIRVLDPRGPSAGAVLCYHGLRSSLDSLVSEAHFLTDAGMTAVLVDAPHHGSRFSEVLATMPDALSLAGHYVLLRLLREARDELPALVDRVHAMGHARVAVCGVSFGGFIALTAAATEPRLAAAVSILGSPDWTPRDGLVPDDLRDAVAESPHLRPEAFPPTPLLMLNGAHDENVRPGPARHLAEALRPLYAAGGHRLVHREYPTGHFPDPATWRDMWSTAATFLRESF